MTRRMVAFSSACVACSEALTSYPPLIVGALACGPAAFGLRPGASHPFATSLLEGALDPGPVDRAGLDGLHGFDLALLLLVSGGEDFLREVERHADEAVVIADDQVARLDDHAVDGDRAVHLAGSALVGTPM